ncbi:hypothetical protein PsYK624_046400 [Phanerochaete sordida]|uniref:Uncharacterized protein n=1 Tax=Phanerochaete sordida TaxID=48140 RepID=A0A9P3LC64_9APHY|nr:hypothetical protein PsYK624_046400 [Phanerochaete sordida]
MSLLQPIDYSEDTGGPNMRLADLDHLAGLQTFESPAPTRSRSVSNVPSESSLSFAPRGSQQSYSLYGLAPSSSRTFSERSSISDYSPALGLAGGMRNPQSPMGRDSFSIPQSPASNMFSGAQRDDLEFNRLLEHYQQARIRIAQLESECSTLRQIVQAFGPRLDELIKHFKTAATRPEGTLQDGNIPDSLPQLSRSDHLKVKFWDIASFREMLAGLVEARKRQAEETGQKMPRALAGEGDRWLILKDGNGNPLPVAQGDEVRDFTRGLLEDMHAVLGDNVPSSWNSKAPALWRSYMEYHLEKKYEFLHYCENHWKARQLVVYYYPIWQEKYRKDRKDRKGQRTAKFEREETASISSALTDLEATTTEGQLVPIAVKRPADGPTTNLLRFLNL